MCLGETLVQQTLKPRSNTSFLHFLDTRTSISTHPAGKGEETIWTTHHQVSYHHDQQEDEKAQGLPSYFHAVPHGLDPLPAQDTEDDEKRMEEIIHVPPWQVASCAYLLHVVQVTFPKKLHSYHGENKDDDCQHKGEVPKGAHGITDDFDESI